MHTWRENVFFVGKGPGRAIGEQVNVKPMEPIPYSSLYAFYPTRTYLTQPQPLERIVCTDNRTFDMICSGALPKILQR